MAELGDREMLGKIKGSLSNRHPGGGEIAKRENISRCGRTRRYLLRSAELRLQHHFNATIFLVAKRAVKLRPFLERSIVRNDERWIDLA